MTSYAAYITTANEETETKWKLLWSNIWYLQIKLLKKCLAQVIVDIISCIILGDFSQVPYIWKFCQYCSLKTNFFHLYLKRRTKESKGCLNPFRTATGTCFGENLCKGLHLLRKDQSSVLLCHEAHHLFIFLLFIYLLVFKLSNIILYLSFLKPLVFYFRKVLNL